ncbi:MAG TPA: lactate racemase domain-containing protein, partial [Spirochaetales bacterium]|nr:lactate racemase domain-containing protein [Spirochaetales bacterium]
MPWFFERGRALSRQTILELTQQCAETAKQRYSSDPKRILLLPPDITRIHSGSGWITEALYNYFAPHAEVFIMPTLGQHQPHTPQQNKKMFGSIPEDHILKHDCITGVKTVGSIPRTYVSAIMEGKADWDIPISVNSILFDKPWDIIISVGQVVPHEVVGFANHNKNFIIGIGG